MPRAACNQVCTPHLVARSCLVLVLVQNQPNDCRWDPFVHVTRHDASIWQPRQLAILTPKWTKTPAFLATRSSPPGQLVISMPKEDPHTPIADVSRLRPKIPGTTGTAAQPALHSTTAAVGGGAGAAAATNGRAGGPGPHGKAGQGGGGSGTSIYNIVNGGGGAGGKGGEFVIKEVRRAAVTAVEDPDQDGDDPPDL